VIRCTLAKTEPGLNGRVVGGSRLTFVNGTPPPFR